MITVHVSKVFGTALRAVLFLVVFSLQGILTSAVYAGTMQITPLRAEVTNQNKNAIFEVFNPTDHELSIQLQPVTWTQEGKQEIYQKTTDILAVPVLFTIPPRKSQTVRAALMRPNQSDLEQSYRLIFTEIQKPRTDGDSNAPISLRMRLQINLPVFVLPQTPVKPTLEFIGLKNTDEKTSLAFKNTGKQHLQIKEMKFINTDGSEQQLFTSNYFLPNTSKEITPKDIDLSSARKVIFRTDNSGDIEYELK